MDNSNKIEKYKKSDYIFFKDMFEEYFLKDFKIELTEIELEQICTEITQRIEAGVVFLDLLTQNGAAKGFVIYQIDSPKSDWCEKEGYGFIREIFVVPELRKKGIGKDLVIHAEYKLREWMVPCIYLTSDESIGFWLKMGYCDSGEISAINSDRIFIKDVSKQ